MNANGRPSRRNGTVEPALGNVPVTGGGRRETTGIQPETSGVYFAVTTRVCARRPGGSD